MDDLHGVFAYTVYGDRIRVSHYGPWNDIQLAWNLLDHMIRDGVFPLLKFVAVRSWDDPDWNLSRYISLETVAMESEVA